MSMDNLAYARIAYKSFTRSARHLLQLIGSHQSPVTGWAYLSYVCLSEEASLTRRRVIQLVALLEARGVLEVRRGHGRGHVNFYRILREEDGLPVPHRPLKKVKSATPSPQEKVKFPTPPEPEKVKSQPPKSLESLAKAVAKVVETKERKDKAEPPVSLSIEDGAAAHEDGTISPEMMHKFGLRINVADWTPPGVRTNPCWGRFCLRIAASRNASQNSVERPENDRTWGHPRAKERRKRGGWPPYPHLLKSE